MAAAASALAVLALGPAQGYWICVPALMWSMARTRTRRGSAAATVAIIAAAALPTASGAVAGHLPPPALALLVPVVSAAVLLGVRERLEAEREDLRRSALTDALTGVPNRRALLLRADYEVVRHARTHRPLAVLMLDLDGFKALNDRFGHAAGDELLGEVARAITGAVRAQDTVARLGGDEFCVLAPETDSDGARDLTARVVAAVRTVTVGLDVVAASAGAAAYPRDGRTVDVLLEAADQRLLEAKRRRDGRAGRRAA